MHYRCASSLNNVYSSGGGSNSRSSRSRAPPPAPRSTVTLENLLQYENRGGPSSRGYKNSGGRSANVRTASNMNAGGGGDLGRSNNGWRYPLPSPPPPPQSSHHHHQYHHHHHHGPSLLMDNNPGWGSIAGGGSYEGQSSQFIDPSQPSQGDPISSQNSLGGAGSAPPPPSAAAPPSNVTRHHSSASNSSTNIDIMVTAKRQEKILDSLSSLLREVSLIKDQLGSGTGPSAAAAAASATLASVSASASVALDAEQGQDFFEKASQTMNTKLQETERDLIALKDDMSRVDEKTSTIGCLVESLETRLDKNLDELNQQMKQVKDQLQEQSSASNAIEEMKQVVASLSEEIVKSRTTMKTLEAKTSLLLLETTPSSSPKGKQQQQQQQQQENSVMKAATPPPTAATTTPQKTMTSTVGHQPEEEEGQEHDQFFGTEVGETLGELSPDMLAGYEESLDFPRRRSPSSAPTSTRVAPSPGMTMSYDEYIAKRQQQMTTPLKLFSISAATAAGSTNTNRKISTLSAPPIKSTAPAAAASARNSSATGRKALPRTLERRMTRQQSNSQRGGSSMKQHTQEEKEESEGQQQVYDEFDFDRNEGEPLLVEAPRRRNQQQASSLKRRRQG